MEQHENQSTPDTFAPKTDVLEGVDGGEAPEEPSEDSVPDWMEKMPMASFLLDYGEALLAAVKAGNPAIYDGQAQASRAAVLDGLSRNLFAKQAECVHAAAQLLLDERQRACVINGEMGTGKTITSIALAAVLHQAGLKRSLVLSPPHLVYKWRREIKATIPRARVWILNGPDTLATLLRLRKSVAEVRRVDEDVPEFFILGRIRMRLGYDWRPALVARNLTVQLADGTDGAEEEGGSRLGMRLDAACPHCYAPITAINGEPMRLSVTEAYAELSSRRSNCRQCKSPLWTAIRHGQQQPDASRRLLRKALERFPTIGPKRAEHMLTVFGEALLKKVLEDNLYEFVNLMDADGEYYFSDRQARRIERSLGSFELGMGQGGYQPSEFIKRYLPKGYFATLIADEGHEYKALSSAQGLAMGTLASQVKKVVVLSGTLMGGYADDLYYLLLRMNPTPLIDDGFGPTRHGTSLSGGGMNFMRAHGILKHIYTERSEGSFKSSRGTKRTVSVTKAPGFSPLGIMRFVVPITAFMKLKDIDAGVLPPFKEEYREVAMSEVQRAAYDVFAARLQSELRDALRKRDKTLLGVVINALLAWPECCFRTEIVKHPRTGVLIAQVPALFDEASPTPKERDLINVCLEEKGRGRRVLAYTCYTGKRDTASRLKSFLVAHGLRAEVLRSTVAPDKREDWIAEAEERGIDVLITNQELVKTGLDLLGFPTIYFMQTNLNVYTLVQASRRSWRIGQTEDVVVYYGGYEKSAQTEALKLMAKKIAVSQSTQGDMPESGLEALSDGEAETLDVQLAKQLLSAAAESRGG